MNGILPSAYASMSLGCRRASSRLRTPYASGHPVGYLDPAGLSGPIPSVLNERVDDHLAPVAPDRMQFLGEPVCQFYGHGGGGSL